MKKAKISPRDLTRHLREEAALIHDTELDDDGNVIYINKAEQLGRVVWRKALGWVEECIKDDGTIEKKDHPPQQWAITLIFDRVEGKAAQSVPDEMSRISVADKVSEISKNQISSLTDAVVEAALDGDS
jgi:hypothetical protein